MTCRRKFDPRYQDFSIPDWKPLSDEDALQAALALEKARAEKGPPTETVTRFAKTRAMVERAAASGELKVWEARFDIAHNGEKVRVVLVSNGECGAKYKYSENDPTFGVLLPDKFEADPRYRNLTHYPGDLFLYKGTTYVAKWSNFPGSTLNDRIPPPRHHRGYLLVQSIYWSTLTGEQAGPYETECQFGYEHLDSAKKGNEQ